MLKVLIADDHPIFREALIGILREGNEAFDITEANSLIEARELANDDLDLILLDLKMPNTTGFEALIALRNQVPAVPIIVVSASEAAETIKSAATYGASGYIPKSLPKAEIRAAVETVVAGGVSWPEIDPAAAPPIRGGDPDVADKVASLTPAEMRVFECLAQGKPNKQIAYELDIRETTVKAHITSILRKLKVHSRAQAILAASSLKSGGLP